MRLFVAISVPSQLAGDLVRAARDLLPAETGPRIRWTKPANMHLTLSFLGSVEPGRLEPVQQSLACLRAPRLHLELSGLGTFAGVLHIRVTPSAALLALAERVSRSMEGCGFPREQRPFRPHLTLARAQGRFPLSPFRQSGSPFGRAFAADEFRLYQSFTKGDGPYYEVLRAFPLG